MDLLLKLVQDPLTYVVVIALWAGRRYFERRIDAGVDQRFAERLEAYKQSLTVLTEQAKFDFQRRLFDFNLFAQRKHDAAGKVWEVVRIAHGYISSLSGFSREHTFEEFNETDILTHMESRGVPKGKQQEIQKLWDTNRSEAIQILRPYLRMLRIQDADRKLQEAKNMIYLNELYFSEGSIKALDQFVEVCAEWITHAEFPDVPDQTWRPDRKAFHVALETLHDSLRAEITGAGSTNFQIGPVDSTPSSALALTEPHAKK